MGNKGKLAAASFIAGAAAALYASKQINKTASLSAAENNSFESFSKTKAQTQNYNPRTAESNNFFTKAPIIDTDNNSKAASKGQSYNNLYFENIPNSESIGNNLMSKSENDTANLNTALRIDSW